MSNTAENDDVEIIESQEDENQEEIETDPVEIEEEPEEGESEEESDEVIVSIGDAPPASEEEPEGRAPQWVRDLRKEKREADKELRELRRQLAEREAANKPATQEVAKPTLEDCDYDTEEYERKYDAWTEQKRKQDEEKRKQESEKEEAAKAWQEKVDAYNKAKAELKVSDFEDAEEAVVSALSTIQQGIIMQGADKPVLMICALGKNKAKLKELSEITDPVKFAFAIAKLETQVKTSPRKAPPAPEGKVRGNAAPSGAVDNTLERLRAEAEKSGDMSKVIAYRAKQRASK